MKTSFKLMVLLTAALALTACEREETSQEGHSITYVVASDSPATPTTVHINSGRELDALLDNFCDYAQHGKAVTFRSDKPHTKSPGAKESTTISTTSREEIKQWMERMEDAGMTVTVTYDSKTGTYNGIAYSATAQPPAEEGPIPSRITYDYSYDNTGMEGDEDHIVCTFTWEGGRLSTVDMVERHWHQNSDGTTGDTSVLHSIATLSYTDGLCTSVIINDADGDLLERFEYTYIDGLLATEWRWVSSTTKTYIYADDGKIHDIQNTELRGDIVETTPNQFHFDWENDNLKYITYTDNGRPYQTVEYDNTLRPRGVVFGSLTFMPGYNQFFHPQILWSRNNMTQLEWYSGAPRPLEMDYTYSGGKPVAATMQWFDGSLASWTYEYID